MSSQRLSALAIMNKRRNHPIDYTEIVKVFIHHPRKFNWEDLFFSEEI